MRGMICVVDLPAPPPLLLQPTATAGPYPLLTLLQASALLRPTLDDADGPAQLHLALQLHDAQTGVPVRAAAVLAARRALPGSGAVQITDAHGRLGFRWRGAGARDLLHTPLDLVTYLTRDGHVCALGSATLSLPPAPPGHPATDPLRLQVQLHVTLPAPFNT